MARSTKVFKMMLVSTCFTKVERYSCLQSSYNMRSAKVQTLRLSGVKYEDSFTLYRLQYALYVYTLQHLVHQVFIVVVVHDVVGVPLLSSR